MKIGVCFICLIFCFIGDAQTIQCKVLDAEDNKPLYFATITYGKESKITFSDSLGNFYLSEELLNTADSFIIDFVGYSVLKIDSKNIIPNQAYFLTRNKQNLEEIIVKDCKEYEEVNLNFKLRSGSHYSVSPFIPFVFAGYYSNKVNKTGYLNTFSLKVEINSKDIKNLTPIRLHWYSLDLATNTIDKELTTTNILLYPYKSGINTFKVPNRTIFFGEEGIVLGIEFLYTHEQEKSWSTSKLKDERDWIKNNGWYFAIQRAKIIEGFAGWGNKSFNPFESVFKDNPKKYFKPLFNFTITTCK